MTLFATVVPDQQCNAPCSSAVSGQVGLGLPQSVGLYHDALVVLIRRVAFCLEHGNQGLIAVYAGCVITGQCFDDVSDPCVARAGVTYQRCWRLRGL